MQDNKTCVWKHTVKDRKSLPSISTSKQSHTWELCAKGRPREVASVAFCTFCGFNQLFYFSNEESRSNTFVLGNVVIVLTAANCFARKSKSCLIQGSNQVHPQMPVPFSGKGQEMFGIFCNVYQSSQSSGLQEPYNKLLRKHGTFFIPFMNIINYLWTIEVFQVFLNFFDLT